MRSPVRSRRYTAPLQGEESDHPFELVAGWFWSRRLAQSIYSSFLAWKQFSPSSLIAEATTPLNDV